MFSISPNQVRVIIIISQQLESSFLSFLFDTCQYSWIERDFTSVSKKLESIGTILIKEDDTRLERVFRKFYEVSGIIYYFIGTNNLLSTTTVDPFIHGIYIQKDQWKQFDSFYKKMYGMSFNDHIKEIK